MTYHVLINLDDPATDLGPAKVSPGDLLEVRWDIGWTMLGPPWKSKTITSNTCIVTRVDGLRFKASEFNGECAAVEIYVEGEILYVPKTFVERSLPSLQR